MTLEEHMDSHESEGISLVVPAYNEADNIGPLIEAAQSELQELARPWEIIIVNDGSSDQTSLCVKESMRGGSNVLLVEHDRNLGYGAALRTGFATAQFGLICFTDADRQFELEDLRGLIERIDDCHLVAGVRSPRQDPWHRRVLGRLWTWGIDRAFNVGVRDLNCAFKLVRKDALSTFQLHSTGAFINAEIVIRMREQGFEIQEVPVRHRPRREGTQSGAKVKVIVHALGEAFRYRTQHYSSSTLGPRNSSKRRASLTSTSR